MPFLPGATNLNVRWISDRDSKLGNILIASGSILHPGCTLLLYFSPHQKTTLPYCVYFVNRLHSIHKGSFVKNIICVIKSFVFTNYVFLYNYNITTFTSSKCRAYTQILFIAILGNKASCWNMNYSVFYECQWSFFGNFKESGNFHVVEFATQLNKTFIFTFQVMLKKSGFYSKHTSCEP